MLFNNNTNFFAPVILNTASEQDKIDVFDCVTSHSISRELRTAQQEHFDYCNRELSGHISHII